MSAVDVVEHELLLSGPLALAAHEGRKTQTRRPLDRVLGFGKITEFGRSNTPGYAWHFRCARRLWQDFRDADLRARCPYGRPGDRLWVRETWAPAEPGPLRPGMPIVYRADYLDDVHGPDGERSPEGRYRWWKPSIHMPRWASRTTLVVLSVRVQQLIEIDEADARAEAFVADDHKTARRRFLDCWDSIYGGADLLTPSPWVWAPTFELVDDREKEG